MFGQCDYFSFKGVFKCVCSFIMIIMLSFQRVVTWATKPLKEVLRTKTCSSEIFLVDEEQSGLENLWISLRLNPWKAWNACRYSSWIFSTKQFTHTWCPGQRCWVPGWSCKPEPGWFLPPACPVREKLLLARPDRWLCLAPCFPGSAHLLEAEGDIQGEDLARHRTSREILQRYSAVHSQPPPQRCCVHLYTGVQYYQPPAEKCCVHMYSCAHPPDYASVLATDQAELPSYSQAVREEKICERSNCKGEQL